MKVVGRNSPLGMPCWCCWVVVWYPICVVVLWALLGWFVAAVLVGDFVLLCEALYLVMWLLLVCWMGCVLEQPLVEWLGLLCLTGVVWSLVQFLDD